MGYTYLEAVDLTADQPLNDPKNQFNLTVTRRIQKWTAALTGRYVDATPSYQGGSALPSREVYDFTLARKSPRGLQPFLIVRNLTNEHHEEVIGYPIEGRSLEAGVSTSW